MSPLSSSSSSRWDFRHSNDAGRWTEGKDGKNLVEWSLLFLQAPRRQTPKVNAKKNVEFHQADQHELPSERSATYILTMLPVAKGDHVFNGQGEQEWEIQRDTSVLFAIYGRMTMLSERSPTGILVSLQGKISTVLNCRSPRIERRVNGSGKIPSMNWKSMHPILTIEWANVLTSPWISRITIRPCTCVYRRRTPVRCFIKEAGRSRLLCSSSSSFCSLDQRWRFEWLVERCPFGWRLSFWSFSWRCRAFSLV